MSAGAGAGAAGHNTVNEEEIVDDGILTDTNTEMTTSLTSPRPLVPDSRPASDQYGSALIQQPPTIDNLVSCRCHGCDGTSLGSNNNNNSNTTKPHHKQLYFWHTHFSPKLLPSIHKILRDEGPAGTVRILSCTGLVAEAVSLVLHQAARVSILVLSGLAVGDVQPTMKALHRAVDGRSSEGMVGIEEDDDADMGTPLSPLPCKLCSRPLSTPPSSSSIRILRILETTLGNGIDDENDDVSLSLFNVVGHSNCSIQQLDLSKCRLSPGAVHSLATSLSMNTTITVLKLNEIRFTTTNVVPIEEMEGDLSRNSDHSRTGFASSEWTSITASSSCPLATILMACICVETTEQQSPYHRRVSNLRELHLSQVEVSEGSDAMVALCQLLPSLETLDLSGSVWRSARTSSSTAFARTTLSPRSVEPVTILLDTLTGTYKNDDDDVPFCLNHLILSGIPLSETNISQLCRALQHPVAGPLHQLESIELQNCQLTEAAMLGMMESIPRWSTTLNRVDVARNFLRPTIVGGLLYALERNYILQDLGRPLLLHDKTHQKEHQLLEYLLDCNWAGRRVFRQSYSDSSSSSSSRLIPHEGFDNVQRASKVIPGLWPYLLERINEKPIRRTKHHYSHDGPGRRESLLFAMIRGPALLEPR